MTADRPNAHRRENDDLKAVSREKIAQAQEYMSGTVQIAPRDGYRSLKMVGYLFVLLAAVFFLRLLFLQVIVAGDYSANAEESRTVNFDVAPHRGTIYDRNGVVLAMSVDAMTVYCNPTEVENANVTATELAKVMGGDANEYIEKLQKRTTTFAYLARQIDVDVAQRVKEAKLKGIYLIEDSRREYPYKAVGGQVVGVCDVDGNGICGLELQYDDILRGTPGTYSAERGEQGTPIPGGVHEDTPAIDGQDIMVSIDIRVQEAAEKELKEEVERNGGERGSALLLEAKTGEIYAACSYPYLDPTNLEDSMIGSDNLIPFTEPIEPGSMLKAVTALAVLEQGKLEPDDELFVPVSLDADEYTITDSHEREAEKMSFRKILSESSNVGISLALDKVGFKSLYEILKRSNFAELTGVDFPGEAAGSLDDVDEWSHIGGYNISFGQGLAITSIQLVRFYAAIENGGIGVQPHFLISYPQKNEFPEYETNRIISDQDAISKLTYMMRGVVEEGTGTGAEIEGYDVVGKTSTAQIAEDGGYNENNYNHLFGGFIENSSSDFVCFASVNNVPAAAPTNVFHDIMVDVIDMYNIVPK